MEKENLVDIVTGQRNLRSHDGDRERQNLELELINGEIFSSERHVRYALTFPVREVNPLTTFLVLNVDK